MYRDGRASLDRTITASAGTGGTISPSGVVPVTSGTNQSFTITPDASYHIADVLVDGVSVGAVASYAFTNVTANHTIAASFAIDMHALTHAPSDPARLRRRAVIVGHGKERKTGPLVPFAVVAAARGRRSPGIPLDLPRPRWAHGAHFVTTTA